MSKEQMVVFLLDQEEYAVPITQVKEIISYSEATKLPTTLAYFEGVINLRGRGVPVVDLAAKIGIDQNERPHRKAIITEADGCEIGVIVDEITEVLTLQASEMGFNPFVVTDNRDPIRGIGKVGKRLLVLLQLSNLFDNEELAAFQHV